MGLRHTQSILNANSQAKSYVLELNKDVFDQNVIKLGADAAKVTWIKDVNEISENIDFCVIATVAGPRSMIMETLLAKGVKSFLVEKVVFQSAEQFSKIISLLEKNGAKAYCNFVNRYYPNYKDLKLSLTAEPIKMSVMGGEFGLGCNSLHYVDLFQYLTGLDVILESSSLVKDEGGNKRGVSYQEVLGNLGWKTAKGDQLIVSSDVKREGGIEITIIQGDTTHVINQQTLKHLTATSSKNGISIKPFELMYTSALTSILLEDINKGAALLPTIQETKDIHVQLFWAVNKALGLSEDELCPIT